MINQTGLLNNLINEIFNSKEKLHDEFRANYERPGVSVEELNVQYRTNYQSTQDALMKCMRILIAAANRINPLINK